MASLFDTAFSDPFFQDPLREFRRMQRDMNRILSGFGVPETSRLLAAPEVRPLQTIETQLAWSPPTDVYDMGDHLVILMELPGVDKNDIHLEYTGRKLLISGRKNPGTREVSKLKVGERDFGEFRRKVNVGRGIDENQIKAKIQEGILEINVPKHIREQGQGQVRKIQVGGKEEAKAEGQIGVTRYEQPIQKEVTPSAEKEIPAAQKEAMPAAQQEVTPAAQQETKGTQIPIEGAKEAPTMKEAERASTQIGVGETAPIQTGMGESVPTQVPGKEEAKGTQLAEEQQKGAEKSSFVSAKEVLEQKLSGSEVPMRRTAEGPVPAEESAKGSRGAAVGPLGESVLHHQEPTKQQELPR